MSDIPAQSDKKSQEEEETNPSSSTAPFVTTKDSAERDKSTRPKRAVKPPERYAPSDYNPQFHHFKQRGKPRGQSPYSGVVTRSHASEETVPIPVPQYNTPRRDVLESPLDIGFHRTPPQPVKKQAESDTPISGDLEQITVRSRQLFPEFNYPIPEESQSPDKPVYFPEFYPTQSPATNSPDFVSADETSPPDSPSNNLERTPLPSSPSLSPQGSPERSQSNSRSHSPLSRNSDSSQSTMPDDDNRILRTIPAPESVTIFKGRRRPCDVSFTPGPSLSDWLRSIIQYFRGTGITSDVEKIQRLPGYCDTQQGDAHRKISQLALENEGKTFDDLIAAVKVLYADSQTEIDFGKLNDLNRIPLPPLLERYDVADMLSTVRDHARKLSDAFLALPCNNSFANLPEAQRRTMATLLRRFIFCNVAGASLPRRAMKEKIYDVSNDRDLLTYTAEIQAHVTNNYTLQQIQEASRRTNIKLAHKEYYPNDFDERTANQAALRSGGKVFAIQQTREEESIYPIISNDDQYNNFLEEGQEIDLPMPDEEALCAYGTQTRNYPRGNFRPQNLGNQSFSSARGGLRSTSNYSNQRPGVQNNKTSNFSTNTMNQNNRGNFATSIRSSDSSGIGSGIKRGDNPCYVCHKRGHRFTQCSLRPRFSDLGGRTDQCAACYGYDHEAHHHALAHHSHGPIRLDAHCDTCNGVAHLSEYCPTKLAQQRNNLIRNVQNNQRPQSQPNFHQQSGRNRPPN